MCACEEEDGSEVYESDEESPPRQRIDNIFLSVASKLPLPAPLQP
jgi:hypothetical protein